MELKFYLNKFAKVDNIEGYTYKNVLKLRDAYEHFLEMSEGKDPDFPYLDMGGKKKGKTISKGKNVYSMFDENDIPEGFNGIETRLKNNDKKSTEIIQLNNPREARRRNTRNRKKE